MFENAITTNQQGNIGLSYAIAYYSKLGYFVSVPLTDSQDYDIIIDTGSSLLKVQVKTTKFKADNGNYVVNLTTKGRSETKTFESNSSDLLFALTDSGVCYSIPTSEIKATRSLTLGNKYDIFKVSLW